jgi:hypothetical protein
MRAREFKGCGLPFLKHFSQRLSNLEPFVDAQQSSGAIDGQVPVTIDVETLGSVFHVRRGDVTLQH